jgi:NAD(P)H-hydrate epimerase
MSDADELRARFGALTADQVAALDRAAVAGGVSVMQLMEIAGLQVARAAWRMIDDHPATVVVIAGRGNNGGDGLVAARHLATWGCRVSVLLLTEREQLEGLLKAHADSAELNGVSLDTADSVGTNADALASAALFLDGILGTGLHSAPRERAAAVIRALNAIGSRVLSIDIPSGMDATTGEIFDPCARATATVTLAAVKAGLWSRAAAEVAGELWVADIGMPRYAWQSAGLEVPGDVHGGALLPVPSATSH